MWEKWATSSSSKWLRPLFSLLVWLLGFIGVSNVEKFVHIGDQSVWRLLQYSLFAVALLLLLSPIEWICRRITQGRRASRARNIVARYAKPDEADEIFRFCRTFYDRDDHVINRSSLEDFLKANPNTAKIFTKNGEPVGLYIVFAINKEACRRLLDCSIVSAQQLNAKYAIRQMRWATGLYVTNVCGRGTLVRGIVLQELKNDLKRYLVDHRSIRYLFARMANEDGARIIKKNQFAKISNHQCDQQIWKYEVGLKIPD